MVENKKRTLILSALCVIVLVITIIGVSFALFSFMGTGIVENKITTGSVDISYSDTYDENNNPLGKGVIKLVNAFPQSDEDALVNQDNVMDFAVSASMSGQMSINYDIGISDLVEGDSLTADHIKIALLDDNGFVLGSSTVGEILSSRKNKMGLYELIDHYYLASGNFSEAGTHHYKLIVWIADDYNMPVDVQNDGVSHTATSVSENFSFKISVVASQA